MADPADRRRFAVADVEFDEAQWTLTVAGRPAALEGKPLDVLRYLLQHPGLVVTKSQLLDAVWPDVEVVEASLPTAIHKLRAALHDEARHPPLIETVPRVGYRLNGEVRVCNAAAAGQAALPTPSRRRLGWITALVVAVACAGLFVAERPRATPAATVVQPTVREVFSAVRRLDYHAFERMEADGWNPNMPIDPMGGTALHLLMETCEWNPDHDRNAMLLTMRTLLDGGADATIRNSFGDTAYSIVKAKRFCGPDHPVTVALRRICTNKSRQVDPRCLASYELAKPKA